MFALKNESNALEKSYFPIILCVDAAHGADLWWCVMPDAVLWPLGLRRRGAPTYTLTQGTQTGGAHKLHKHAGQTENHKHQPSWVPASNMAENEMSQIMKFHYISFLGKTNTAVRLDFIT